MKPQARDDEALLEMVPGQAIVNVQEIPSPVLRRLIEEVRTESVKPTASYNRVHNRHNRGR